MKQFSILLFASLITIAIHAQPGTIDKSYGTDNTGTVSVLKPLYVTSSVMQPDNKLVLGVSGPSSDTEQYILIRHNKDGSVDTSFGREGQTVIAVDDLVTNVLYAEGLNAVAVQPDGKIVASGNITSNAFDNNILVVRVLPDGTPDESFGSHGRVITDLGEFEIVTAVAVQADGKILISGYQDTDIFGNGNGILLIRYNLDGTIDKTFGDNKGYTLYTEQRGTHSNALVLQPDGKILTAGYISGIPAKFFLVRYLSNGRVDKSFGMEGVVKTSFSSINGDAYINSLALDEKSRIAATGTIGSEEGVGVARYLPDGAPDNSFGENGKLVLGFVPFIPASVTGKKVFTQPDGKLIIYSSIAGENDALYRTALSGLNEDGSPDASFGTDKGQTIFNSAYADEFSYAAMQSDGKIVISGNKVDNKFNYIGYSLTRFTGYPTKVPLAIRVKRFLLSHGISWKGLPAEDKIISYTVEQSSSNKTGFAPVAKVSGAANQKNYSITNSHLLEGINFYRIKAVSTDGTIRYSETVSADNTANTASVFPNPAKNYVTVQGLKTSETANISISDGSGNIKARGVSTGSIQYRSSLNNLQPGTYYVNITTKEKTETLKFVKE